MPPDGQSKAQRSKPWRQNSRQRRYWEPGVHAWRSDESRAFGRSETTFHVTGPPFPMRLVLTVRQ